MYLFHMGMPLVFIYSLFCELTLKIYALSHALASGEDIEAGKT